MKEQYPTLPSLGCAPLARSSENRRLEIILKVAERCNINCTYCYFFNAGDESYREHPASISRDTIQAVANFVREGAYALGIDKVHIILHGGEPLLLGKVRFAMICEQFLTLLAPSVTPVFFVQTNAMLVDEGWVDVFGKYHVNVGVSIDGPAEYHDKERVDFRGRGTYQRVIKGVATLREAVDARRIDNLGALCVINAQHDAQKIYRHFVDTLGLKSIDFLLPDVTYETVPKPAAEAYGRFLCELFDAWTTDDDPTIEVRVLYSIFSLLLGGPSFVEGYGTQPPFLVTIGSDGSVGHGDTLRACGADIRQHGDNVRTTTLRAYLKSPLVIGLEQAYSDLSETCQQCCWRNVCGGGMLVNRYSKMNGFKNPSVFCAGLKMFYTHAANYLLAKGLPIETLQNTLFIDSAFSPEGRIEA